MYIKVFKTLVTILIVQGPSSSRSSSVVLGNISTESNEDDWIVQTTSGPVEGLITEELTGSEVYAFYGIPYAEPPLGEFRFKPPQPIKPWTEVFKASHKPLPCYQQQMKYSWIVIRNETQQIRRPWSEDCLTLNIWVPKPRLEDAPVLVVFHPGTFGQGSNSYPDGSTLATYSQVVVVSMNYRLGAFGFLHLGVSDAPGNMGLLDQQLALKWIQKNINKFGGKTDAIILVGAGNAGGASVRYHLLSPGSANIFKSVNSFSGSSNCPWAFQETHKSLENARVLAERIGCNKTTIDLELQCLRIIHPEDIVDASSGAIESTSLEFLPTVDGTFLKESPLEALKSGHINNAVVFSISNANEASLLFWLANKYLLDDIENGINIGAFRKTLRSLMPSMSKSTLKAVEEYYIGECNLDDPLKIRDAAINVYSDVLFDCCINEFDYYLSKKGSNIFRIVEDIGKHSNPSWVKASHAISIEYIFGYTLIDDGFGAEEKEITKLSIELIYELSRRKAIEMQDLLSPFDITHKNYTIWDMKGQTHFSHYREDQCKLWNEIIPKLERSKKSCTNV